MGGDPRQLRLHACAALLLGVSAAATARAATVQDFDGPGTTYTLSQHLNPPAPALVAGPDGNFLRLFSLGGSDSINTIGFDLSDPGSHPSIVADFDFRIAGGADGLSFMLLDTSVYGGSGPGPGFGERPLVQDSLGIAFDVWQNPEVGDPNDNFIMLTFDEQVVTRVANPGVALDSGSFLHARLEVGFVPGGATVSLDLTPAGGSSVSPLQDFFVAAIQPYEARVAFGARDGAVSANHDIDNVMVSFVPEPSTASLLALGLAVLAARRARRS